MVAIGVLFLAAVLVQTPAPSKPPAGDAIRFTPGMKPGGARLIDVQGTTSADLTVTVGRERNDVKQRSTVSYRFVDSMVEPGANAWTGWRRFVKAQETDDGEFADPELTGLEADVWCTKEAELHFNARGNRRVATSRMNRLFAEAGAFGLHVGLPAELAPGQECDVDFTALAQICFDLSGKATSAKAHLKLVAVDPKKNVARFSGDVTVEEKVDESESDSSDGTASRATGHYEGTVEVDYDLAAGRVARVACKGKGHVEGDLLMIPPTHVAADSTHDVTITSTEGPAVAAALKEKPQPRDVPHLVNAAGIVVTLPSHWFRAHVADDDAMRFVSMLDGEERQACVRIVDLADPGTVMTEEAAAFSKSLAENNPGMKITESAAASGLGAGRAFDFTINGMHSVANLLQVADGHFVLIQFFAPEAAWESHTKEWPRILKALKRVSAKK